MNTGKVAEYRNKFRSGSTCPPIGVTRDGYLIWGNHRRAGALAADWAAVPAIVFDIDAEGLDEYNTAVLITLSGRENAAHGLPLSTRDREIVVRMELQMETPTNTIAATYGMTPSQISGLRREMDAEARLATLGLSVVDGTSRNVVRALSGTAARSLDDEPFRRLVALVKDSDLTASELNAIAREAKATGSEVGAIDVIAAKRAEMETRIATVASSGVPVRPSPTTKLKSALTQVTSLCESANAAAYRDYTADVDRTVAQIDAAIGCLTAIKEAQQS
jgi:hypothetical protein